MVMMREPSVNTCIAYVMWSAWESAQAAPLVLAGCLACRTNGRLTMSVPRRAVWLLTGLSNVSHPPPLLCYSFVMACLFSSPMLSFRLSSCSFLIQFYSSACPHCSHFR